MLPYRLRNATLMNIFSTVGWSNKVEGDWGQLEYMVCVYSFLSQMHFSVLTLTSSPQKLLSNLRFIEPGSILLGCSYSSRVHHPSATRV